MPTNHKINMPINWYALTLPVHNPPLLPAAAAASPPGAPPAGSLHPSYPAIRRAQRLSYALASVLADVSPNEGRQALLEAPSVSARLRLALAGLRKHRSVLAAVVAVQGLSSLGEGME